MTKITFVGAGSTVFAKNLLGDILSIPEVAEAEINLFDIDDERLHTSEIVAGKTAAAVGAMPAITATTDRRVALDGADRDVNPSVEYGALIIKAIETGEPTVVYGNVMNDQSGTGSTLISNLPTESCVEVPCLVDHNGIQPTTIGQIPPQLAALMQTNINVHSLTVEALMTGNREHTYHAAMFDPHTAAELDLEQIWELVDTLLTAHGDYIPVQFRR